MRMISEKMSPNAGAVRTEVSPVSGHRSASELVMFYFFIYFFLGGGFIYEFVLPTGKYVIHVHVLYMYAYTRGPNFPLYKVYWRLRSTKRSLTNQANVHTRLCGKSRLKHSTAEFQSIPAIDFGCNWTSFHRTKKKKKINNADARGDLETWFIHDKLFK